MLPATRLDDRDVSVGWLVEERFGREVVDRLVEPLLGGVYAGHARELSARAAVPQVVALLDRDRSMMRAAAAGVVGTDLRRTGLRRASAAASAGSRRPWPAASGAAVRTGATVRDLARAAGGGWNLVVGSTRAPEVVHADAVVLATPARATGRLLADVAPEAALRARPRSSTPRWPSSPLRSALATCPPTTGSGFLVPPVDGRSVKAATFSFAKWGWVARGRSCRRRRRPAPAALLDRPAPRGVGAPGRRRRAGRAALADLADAVGLSPQSRSTPHLQRWGGALPQYAVGHLDRVRTIRAAVAALPGLAVCGAAYDGLGIPACIASAELAATQVLAGVGPAGENERT